MAGSPKASHAEQFGHTENVCVERVPTGKIVRATTVELVTDAIRQKILFGDLKPGEVVRQEALAEELGVSRLPIREAITRLKGEGMMTVIPHRGAYVCQLSVNDVRDAFDMRLKLEPWIIQEAISGVTEADLNRADRILSLMKDANDRDWGPLNWQLHETLYAPSKRTVTVGVLKRLHDFTDRYLAFHVVNIPVREQAAEEHYQLIELCRHRKPDLATEVLEAHIRTAADQIVHIVEKVLSR